MEYNVTPKQYKAISDTSSEVLLWGGIRSTKTYGAFIKAITLARFPNAKVGICRKTLSSFKLTTLPLLLEGDAQTPPILERGTYTHNQSTKIIRLNNGGMLQYFSCDDPLNFRGLTLSSLFIDEVTDLSESVYLELIGRISAQVPDSKLQVFSTCNPKGVKHWVAKRFGIVGNEFIKERAQPNCTAYLFQPKDNPYLSQEYLDNLNKYTGVAYDRDVLGKWCSPEGLVYPDFNHSTHVIEREEVYKKYIIGADTGFTDPFAALLIGIDNDNRMHIVKEHYEAGLQEEYQAKIILDMASSVGGVDVVVVDYSGMGAALIENLRQKGLNAVNAKKDIIAGLQKVRDRLSLRKDNRPGITISSVCTNLIKEIEVYEYKQNSEVPKDGQDHLCDVLKYCCAYLDKDSGDLVVTLKMIQSTRTKNNESDKVEELVAKEKNNFDRMIESDDGWNKIG